jgi:hypothetical protein
MWRVGVVFWMKLWLRSNAKLTLSPKELKFARLFGLRSGRGGNKEGTIRDVASADSMARQKAARKFASLRVSGFA